MIVFSVDELKELANHIEKGQTCYVHTTTKEIIAIANFVSKAILDIPQAKKDFITNHPNDFIYINALDTKSSFQILKDYVKLLPDELALKLELVFAINNKKPFQEFKLLIENSSYKNHWYAFRETKIIDFILEDLKRYLPKPLQ